MPPFDEKIQFHHIPSQYLRQLVMSFPGLVNVNGTITYKKIAYRGIPLLFVLLWVGEWSTVQGRPVDSRIVFTVYIYSLYSRFIFTVYTYHQYLRFIFTIYIYHLY